MTVILILPFLLLSGAGLSPESNGMETTTFTRKAPLTQEQNAVVQSPGKKQQKREKPDKVEEEAWEILSKMNVVKATLTKKKGEGNFIEVRVTESGVSRSIPTMQLIGSSGTVSSHNKMARGFRNVSVPFEGRVSFRAASTVGMARVAYDREVHFEVTQAGTWLLLIEI